MNEPLMSIEVDSAGLIAALDRLGPSVEARLKAAARVTADNIAKEARNRVRRRTGHTAAQIRVEEMTEKAGYVVRANDLSTKKHVESWLEFGTVKMSAKPFLFVSARLENPSHDRRMREAIQDAIDDEGLGV